MKSELPEMINNLAYNKVRVGSNGEEYVRFKRKVYKSEKSNFITEDGYTIDMKPMDEYIGDMMYMIKYEAKEQKIELIAKCTIAYFVLSILLIFGFFLV